MAKHKNNGGQDSLLIVLGFAVGVVAGGFALLLRTVLKGGPAMQLIRKSVEIIPPISEPPALTDPIDRSRAEGKAAAHRRRAELGLPS